MYLLYFFFFFLNALKPRNIITLIKNKNGLKTIVRRQFLVAFYSFDKFHDTINIKSATIYTEVMYMLDIIINYHKRILAEMILSGENKETILKESQFLDEYINRKMKEQL